VRFIWWTFTVNHVLLRRALNDLQAGMKGFYKGWGANTIKVVPQNSIRFVTYELFKTLMGIQKAKTDT
jgi:Mitochondrial carrier protein